jgi:hypothetical protein
MSLKHVFVLFLAIILGIALLDHCPPLILTRNLMAICPLKVTIVT